MDSKAQNTGAATTQTGRVLGLLLEQRNLCRKLGSLAERQRTLITGDEPEQLLSVLGDRQHVLDRIGLLSDQLRPYQQRWREVRAAMPEAHGRVADQLVAEVNTLLASILRNDEADAQLLAARKHSTADSMTQLKQSHLAGAAYARAGVGATSGVEWSDE